MVKHIAVALDGSAHAGAAEKLATALALRVQGVVHGVHVIDATFLEGAFITDISGAMGFEPFLNLQSQMRATLDDVADAIRREFTEHCAAVDVECRFHLERSGVAHGILGASKMTDLLVVGQRGVNARFHEDLLGATTETLLRRSQVPILVAPLEAALPVRPLVAYDGSPKAARGLQHAADLARALAVGLTVVTVDTQPERGNALIAEAAGYLAPYDAHVEYRIQPGEAVEEELQKMLGPERHDLVFVGAHGHQRIVELVLGSTSQYLARRSPVPVWCVTRA